MNNYLLLESNEKRIVNAKRFNFVAKALFPVNIRVLDEYGVERDRFSNVVSGFEFELGQQGLWKLEIENGDFGQDIRVFSGDYPIQNREEFIYYFNQVISKPGVSSKYSVIQIKNTSKKSLKIDYIAVNSVYVRLSYYDITNFGDNIVNSYLKDINDNNIEDILLSTSDSSTKPSTTLRYYGIINGSFMVNKNYLLLPSNKSIIFSGQNVNQAIEINLFIKM